MLVRFHAMASCREIATLVNTSNQIPEELRIAVIEEPSAKTDQIVEELLIQYGQRSESHLRTRKGSYRLNNAPGTGRGDEYLETPITALKKEGHYIGILYNEPIRAKIENRISEAFTHEKPVATP